MADACLANFITIDIFADVNHAYTVKSFLKFAVTQTLWTFTMTIFAVFRIHH
jgi:hypothetical protein